MSSSRCPGASARPSVPPISSLAWVVTSSRSCWQTLASPTEVDSIVQRLTAAISLPIKVAGRAVVLGCSVGADLVRDGANPTDLLRHADIALYAAKHEGRGRLLQFEPGDGDRSSSNAWRSRQNCGSRSARARSRWCTNRSWISARSTSRGSKRWHVGTTRNVASSPPTSSSPSPRRPASSCRSASWSSRRHAADSRSGAAFPGMTDCRSVSTSRRTNSRTASSSNMSERVAHDRVPTVGAGARGDRDRDGRPPGGGTACTSSRSSGSASRSTTSARATRRCRTCSSSRSTC